jgi:hypothetical protein
MLIPETAQYGRNLSLWRISSLNIYTPTLSQFLELNCESKRNKVTYFLAKLQLYTIPSLFHAGFFRFKGSALMRQTHHRELCPTQAPRYASVARLTPINVERCD